MIQKKLTDLLKTAPEIQIADQDKILFLSDLHMGNNKRRDDFKRNSKLFTTVLRDYYLKQDYRLVLNGDVEELHKFRLGKIMETWSDVFDLFDQFKARGRLHKMIGNHDYLLSYRQDYRYSENLHHAIKFIYHSDVFLVFHGHQGTTRFDKYNTLFGFLLRHIVKPLGLKNLSKALDNEKKYSIEKNIYEFSSKQHIVSIIGHTHRPLFESMSKEDTLKFKIENLVRLYPQASEQERQEIIIDIEAYKKELHRVTESEPTMGSHLYNSTLLIPCIFNSGCVTGKRGITALEIHDGNIYLIYWYDDRRKQKKVRIYDSGPERLGNSHYKRIVLKHDQLEYVFTRIKLLTQ
ncbi:MAG: metallophosphoesterase family protein [candidate division KSB1 bacterium]|nr:metallophosphoesterase family protein [candidate division KSB1 bacterium]